jgi:uncharacterized protein (TIGR02996 family)
MSFSLWLLWETNEEQGFLNHLKQNPSDTTAWQVFADWLEERGDHRSELIRAIVEIGQSRRSLGKKSNQPLLAKVDEQLLRLSAEWRNLLDRGFPNLAQAHSLDINLQTFVNVLRLMRNDRAGRGVDKALNAINGLIRGYGVEAIEGQDWQPYFMNIAALYVNRGDIYRTTILYDTRRHRFLIASWGDWYERYERRLR